MLQDRRDKDHRTLLLRDMTPVPATQTKSERLKNDLADLIEELDPRLKGKEEAECDVLAPSLNTQR